MFRRLTAARRMRPSARRSSRHAPRACVGAKGPKLAFLHRSHGSHGGWVLKAGPPGPQVGKAGSRAVSVPGGRMLLER